MVRGRVAVLDEPEAVSVSRGVARVARGLEGGAREQIDRRVAAEQIAPLEGDERPRRDRHVVFLPAVVGRARQPARVHAAAAADRARRRFLDGDDDVRLRFAGQPRRLVDGRAAEQAERVDALLALEPRFLAKRVADLERHLLEDGGRGHARVADHLNVRDGDLRALADFDAERHLLAVGREDRLDPTAATRNPRSR